MALKNQNGTSPDSERIGEEVRSECDAPSLILDACEHLLTLKYGVHSAVSQPLTSIYNYLSTLSNPQLTTLNLHLSTINSLISHFNFLGDSTHETSH